MCYKFLPCAETGLPGFALLHQNELCHRRYNCVVSTAHGRYIPLKFMQLKPESFCAKCVGPEEILREVSPSGLRKAAKRHSVAVSSSSSDSGSFQESQPSVQAGHAQSPVVGDVSPVTDSEDEKIVFKGRKTISTAEQKTIVPSRQPKAAPTSIIATKAGNFAYFRKDRFGIEHPRQTGPSPERPRALSSPSDLPIPVIVVTVHEESISRLETPERQPSVAPADIAAQQGFARFRTARKITPAEALEWASPEEYGLWMTQMIIKHRT